MKRIENNKKFVIRIESDNVDIDLMEQQLHSLYKLKNINLDERSYINDLKHSTQTTLDIAKKSFIKAITMTLEKYDIYLEDFDISNIDSYSNFYLNKIWVKDVKINIKKKETNDIIKKEDEKLQVKEVIKNLPQTVLANMPDVDLSTKLSFKHKFTKSAAYKKMLDDLMTWEKDIITKLVEQISTEYESLKK